MSTTKIHQLKRTENPLKQEFWRRFKETWSAEAAQQQEPAISNPIDRQCTVTSKCPDEGAEKVQLPCVWPPKGRA